MTPRRQTIGILAACILVLAAPIPAQEAFDIEEWHEDHPVSQVDDATDSPLVLGLYPRLGAVAGVPNGIAGTAQISLSLRRPGRYGFYVGAGVELGAAVEGGNLTIGWGGVREAPAAVRQYGFSGSFLRFRDWTSDDHGRHRGLSVGVESGLGSFGLTLEAGVTRSRDNHWIPVARLGISFGKMWTWAVDRD